MTNAEIYRQIKTTGLPVAYGFFPADDVPPFPYVTYGVADTQNISADNRVAVIVEYIEINLYTAEKDEENERKIETALSGFFWQKEETLDDGDGFQITYTIANRKVL